MWVAERVLLFLGAVGGDVQLPVGQPDERTTFGEGSDYRLLGRFGSRVGGHCPLR